MTAFYYHFYLYPSSEPNEWGYWHYSMLGTRDGVPYQHWSSYRQHYTTKKDLLQWLHESYSSSGVVVIHEVIDNPEQHEQLLSLLLAYKCRGKE